MLKSIFDWKDVIEINAKSEIYDNFPPGAVHKSKTWIVCCDDAEEEEDEEQKEEGRYEEMAE